MAKFKIGQDVRILDDIAGLLGVKGKIIERVSEKDDVYKIDLGTLYVFGSQIADTKTKEAREAVNTRYGYLAGDDDAYDDYEEDDEEEEDEEDNIPTEDEVLSMLTQLYGADMAKAICKGTDDDEEGEDTTPAHYDGFIQPIELMASQFSRERYVGFLLGNIIKYASRYGKKAGSNDAKKILQYGKWLAELGEF